MAQPAALHQEPFVPDPGSAETQGVVPVRLPEVGAEVGLGARCCEEDEEAWGSVADLYQGG